MDTDGDGEEEEEEQPEPCLYIFEIQVSSEYSGCGLGRRLMTATDLIASSLPEINKITLTVFKSNLPALRFYNKLGFGVDLAVDPGGYDDEEGHFGEENYFILSKRIGQGGRKRDFDQAKLERFLEMYKLVP